MQVSIGRTSGPCTDEEVQSEFTLAEIEVVKDTLAMINKATNNKERWYLRYYPDSPEGYLSTEVYIIPTVE